MIVLVIEIKSGSDSNVHETVSAWADTCNEDEAVAIVGNYLSAEGWKIINVFASEKTDKSDYFRHCSGYESFVQAESEGVAVLMTEEVCTI